MESSKGVRDLYLDKPGPIVMMFRPTRYEIVVPERLKEWEELLATRVGLQLTSNRSETERPTRTVCVCGDGDGRYDDCDAHY
jgi:hypothetical protein